MSKYNEGDKLNLQMVVDDIGKKDNLGFWVTTDRYNEEDGMWLTEEQLDKYSAKTYEQGLEDAWELANKFNNMAMQDIINIYGLNIDRSEVFDKLTPQEALAKLEAYEKAQEIKVGNVVESNYDKVRAVILDEGKVDDSWLVYTEVGTIENWKENGFKKTGKHIDISSILEQIGGDTGGQS